MYRTTYISNGILSVRRALKNNSVQFDLKIFVFSKYEPGIEYEV